uniref:Neuronal guanine nucleotide exchange factor n=1 Tax=Myotis myotis TaxID=51298 RepID=A0A7J7WIV9_MYOMY|nr:neuronal guanine nucleotide exchange factor [Myotis myotis]
METKDSDHLEKPQKKSADGLWELANEPAKVRPELLSEEEKMPQADLIQDKEPRYYNRIQRNSIFNRTVRRRSKGKARDTPESNAGHLEDSPENGKSVKELPALNFSQSRTPLWPIETQRDPGAKRTR